MADTKTLPMLSAVSGAINSVRQKHTGIPEVVVVLGGSGRKNRGQVHGHFAKQAWVDREGEDRTHELFLSGESLARGGKDTLGTIIHELAHAYCAENDIRDTSNHGRYHNMKFREVAEGFGLHIETAKTIGHSVTTVPDDLAAEFSEEISALDEALTMFRDHFTTQTTKKSVVLKMQCPECLDPVPTQKKWFERHEGSIACERHGVPFELIEPEGD